MKDKELLQRYQTTRILLDSVQKTIDNPDKSVTDNLAEGDKTSKKMALVLAKSGSLASEATLASIGTGVIVASKVGVLGITAAAVAGLLTGPLVLGGGIVSLILTFIYKIIERRRSPLWKQKHEERLRRAEEKRTARAEKRAKRQEEKKARGRKALEEKIALLEKIIVMQQAVIDRLKEEDKENKKRINNLQEAIEVLKEAHVCVTSDFEVAA